MITTPTPGIFQGDVLIRTALVEAIRELRNSPWLLDFTFSWLVNDDLSNQQYGPKELDQAKQWFLNTEIPVFMSYRPDKMIAPAISISLEDSAESEAFLGDINAEPSERDTPASDVLLRPNVIIDSFTPLSYDIKTGIVTLPSNLNNTNIFPGMVLFDNVTKIGYIILETIGNNQFTIQSGINGSFLNTTVQSSPIILSFVALSYNSTNGHLVLPNGISTVNVSAGMFLFDVDNGFSYSISAIIDDHTLQVPIGILPPLSNVRILSPSTTTFMVNLERVIEKETYRIDLYVPGDALHLLYLYSILKFQLYRRKQDLLEGRGFDRSMFTTSGIRLLHGKSETELIWTRAIMLTGNVHQYWPKSITAQVDGIGLSPQLGSGILIKDGGQTPSDYEEDVNNQGWAMDGDKS